MILTAYINKKRKVLGDLKEGIFKKTVKKSKHLFRKFDAWGFDYDALVNHIYPQAQIITVYDTEEKTLYATHRETFGEIADRKFIPSEKIQIRRYKSEGADHEAQIFLPRRFWWQTGDTLSLEKIREELGENQNR